MQRSHPQKGREETRKGQEGVAMSVKKITTELGLGNYRRTERKDSLDGTI